MTVKVCKEASCEKVVVSSRTLNDCKDDSNSKENISNTEQVQNETSNSCVDAIQAFDLHASLVDCVLAEFDGTTVLCRVCGDKASGFHYGVHSCEGCKGFFRRSIQQKIQYRPCTKNQQCSILRINRNRCQYCRLKKCIAVGMSRDAVRFGRVPKREKARILAAMQQSSNSRSQEKTLIAELDDEQRLVSTIIRAHIDTCEFTREKIEPLMNRARELPPAYIVHSGSVISPLNPGALIADEDPQNFSKRFSPAIRNVVEFAKRIPGFHLLSQDDQVTLLKAGTFEVLLVRLCGLFDTETSNMLCVNGQFVNREILHGTANARFLMDSMFDFAERFNMFQLTEPEIALYCAIIISAPDRPGLRNVELTERMHMKIKSTLQMMINQSHPGHHEILPELLKKIPDLRTLNTLHSERLLDYKLGDQEQYSTIKHIWMGTPVISDDENFKTESWSADGMMMMVIDDVKSPHGSVSSTESLNSGEIAAANMADYHHHLQQPHVSAHVSSAPLLAATLAGNIGQLRHSQSFNGAGCSSSAGGDDDMPGTSSRLVQNDLTITPVINRLAQQQSSARTYVKVESPTDSGIESDKTASSSGSSGGSSPPTSLCGSPRSSLEDHAAADEKHSGHSSSGSSIVDMPVLKRALQAPPLYDTTSLMDEAYKPHKKFRALRNAKDSAEADPIIVVSPPPMQLQQSLQYQPQKQQQSQLQMHLANSSQSSLSSTHSTLAKSLMEGPRMTAEQMKRTDIIHNYIMRGEAPSSPNNQHSTSPLTSAATTTCYKSPNTGNLLLCATSTMNHNYHYASSSSQQQQQQHWPEQQRNSNSYVNNGTSVITTTTSRPIASSSYVLMQKNSTRVSPSPPQQMYFRTQSPPHSSTSPAPTVKQQPVSPPPLSPAGSGVVVVAPQSTASRVVELQLNIADSQQPLNLSKKSPSPMPRPLSAPTAMHKAVSLEA